MKKTSAMTGKEGWALPSRGQGKRPTTYATATEEKPMPYDDLDMTGADPQADFRTTLSAFGLPDLQYLERNLPNLLSGVYTNGRGRGCVMYFLSDGRITSKTQLLAYAFPDEETRLAARRMIRHFDNGTLPVSMLGKLLAEEIAQRQHLNALEARAIRRARAALAARG
jgi:hypothetical protein